MTRSSLARHCGGSVSRRARSAENTTSPASHAYSGWKCMRSPCTSAHSSCRTPVHARPGVGAAACSQAWPCQALVHSTLVHGHAGRPRHAAPAAWLLVPVAFEA